MMTLDFGDVTAYFAFAFALGLLWYRALRRPHSDHLRMIGFPVLGIVFGETVWAANLSAGPEILRVHLLVAVVASLVTVYADIAARERSLSWWRQPAA